MDIWKILIITALIIGGLNMGLNFGGLFDSSVTKPTAEDGQIWKSYGERNIPEEDINTPNIQQIVGDTIEATANEDTWVDIPNMSIQVNKTGIYQIIYRTTARTQHFSDGGGDELSGSFRMLKNGTSIGSTLFHDYDDSRTTDTLCVLDSPITIIVVENLNKGDTIKMEWKLSKGEKLINIAAGGETKNINTLTLMKID